MTSHQFGRWVKLQRTKKKLSSKALSSQMRKAVGRSYAWWRSLEKRGEFGERELKIISTIAEHFGYELILIPRTIVEKLGDDNEEIAEWNDEIQEEKIKKRNW